MLPRSHKPRSRESKIQTRGFGFPKPGDVKREPEWVTAFPDGREILNTRTKRGRDEYARRREVCARRQGNRCFHCGLAMGEDVTFEHTGPLGPDGKPVGGGRGMNGSRHDDRVLDELGRKLNAASHLRCNTEMGSRRY